MEPTEREIDNVRRAVKRLRAQTAAGAGPQRRPTRRPARSDPRRRPEAFRQGATDELTRAAPETRRVQHLLGPRSCPATWATKTTGAPGAGARGLVGRDLPKRGTRPGSRPFSRRGADVAARRAGTAWPRDAQRDRGGAGQIAPRPKSSCGSGCFRSRGCGQLLRRSRCCRRGRVRGRTRCSTSTAKRQSVLPGPRRPGRHDRWNRPVQGEPAGRRVFGSPSLEPRGSRRRYRAPDA